MTGKAISLFLIDGVPDGRVACELFNWTGKGYKIPRNWLKPSTDREELHKPGIYFLVGRDEARAESNLVYIGEAEDVHKRITQHIGEDFWHEVLLFISKDENLNKAHIKFLEYEVFSEAQRASRYKLVNKNTPTRPGISELEQAVMSEFLEHLQLLVGAMGYKIFEPLRGDTQPASEIRKYFIKGTRGADAQAIITSEGIVVLQGSAAADSVVRSTPKSTRNLRRQLEQDEIMLKIEGKLIFQEDYLFSSPSSAASVVLGRSANGLIEWKDVEGRVLKESEGWR